MTPKEKAKEINDKFWSFLERETAKQCALIVVDEVIKSNGLDSSYCTEKGEFYDFDFYWQEVKKEINKL